MPIFWALGEEKTCVFSEANFQRGFSPYNSSVTASLYDARMWRCTPTDFLPLLAPLPWLGATTVRAYDRLPASRAGVESVEVPIDNGLSPIEFRRQVADD